MKSGNKKIIIYIIAFIVCGVIAFVIYNNITDHNKDDNINTDNSKDELIDSSNETKTFEEKLLGVEINGFMYIMELEDNNSSKDLLYESPLVIKMDKESKGFYGYLSSSLSSEEKGSKHASKGDIMLYNNNCIYLFLEEIDLDEAYILLGHLEEFDNVLIEDDSIELKFVR